MYGGFVQAGVGFILAALAGGLRYDLVRANALKMVCTLAFAFVSVAIFIIFDLIEWVPGLILAGGNMVGAYVMVKVAVRSSPDHAQMGALHHDAHRGGRSLYSRIVKPIVSVFGHGDRNGQLLQHLPHIVRSHFADNAIVARR